MKLLIIILLVCILTMTYDMYTRYSSMMYDLHTKCSSTIASVSHGRYIFIEPVWGLGNRLRTISGAFAAAKKLDAELIIIWKSNEHFPQHINKLFTNLKCEKEIPAYLKVNEIHHSGCELRTNLAHVERNIPCLIKSCMCEIQETEDERFKFYEYAKPSNHIINEIKTYCKDFMTDHTIGIHLRQGDIADARDNHFFGKWTDQKEKLVIKNASDLPCCSKSIMDQAGCPSNIQTIDERLDAIEKDSKYNYWIATDRIQCISIFEKKLAPSQIRYVGCFGKIPDLNSRDMRLALIDMYMLAMCSKFHGSYISSFSHEVGIISKGINKNQYNENK